MPITEAQRLARRGHLGSSDMAALLGVDPWRSAADVYLEKTGRLIDDGGGDGEIDGASALYLGNRLEDSVLDYAEDRLGPLIRNVEKRLDGTPIVVHTDGLVLKSGEPVEAKTHKIVGGYLSDEHWGGDGSDEVPDRVIVQAHAHMLAHAAPVCYVPALIGGRGLTMFTIPFKPRLGDIIAQRAVEFWATNVQGDTPPASSTPHMQIVKRLRHEPGKVIEVDPAIVQAWLDAKSAASTADAAADEAKAALLAALGDAEAGECDALGAVTNYEQTRREYVAKASTFRVLRFRSKGL